MISGSDMARVLDLQTNQAIDMSLRELCMKTRLSTERFMVKDRFGWTHIVNIKEYPSHGGIYIIHPNSPNTSDITVNGDHIIPVYNGKFTPGFHGVACYTHNCYMASVLSHMLEINDNMMRINEPRLLLSAETNRFYEFFIIEENDRRFEPIDIRTKSGYIDINGFSLVANDKSRDSRELASLMAEI